VRLALGPRAASVPLASIAFHKVEKGSAPAAVHCRLRLRQEDGVVLEVEDSAADLESALRDAAWRLQHRLRRNG